MSIENCTSTPLFERKICTLLTDYDNQYLSLFAFLSFTVFNIGMLNFFFFFDRFSLGDARRPLHETALLVEDVVHTQLINLVRACIILFDVSPFCLYCNCNPTRVFKDCIYMRNFLFCLVDWGVIYIKQNFTTVSMQFSEFRQLNTVLWLWTQLWYRIFSTSKTVLLCPWVFSPFPASLTLW